jgi:hypothetical protein
VSAEQALFSSAQLPTGALHVPLEQTLLQHSTSAAQRPSSTVHAPPPATGVVGMEVHPANDATEARTGQVRTRQLMTARG